MGNWTATSFSVIRHAQPYLTEFGEAAGRVISTRISELRCKKILPCVMARGRLTAAQVVDLGDLFFRH